MAKRSNAPIKTAFMLSRLIRILNLAARNGLFRDRPSGSADLHNALGCCQTIPIHTVCASRKLQKFRQI